jgi:putative glutamine amidotransferase
MVAEYALDKKMPILAICRGEQLLNVLLGGKLIVDLPEDMHTEIHQIENSPNSKHEIGIVGGSQLHKLIGKSKGIVNTNHHQAVTYLPNELIPVAFATEDQIIEAYEWREPENKSFLIAVQWHPERLGITLYQKILGLNLLKSSKSII